MKLQMKVAVMMLACGAMTAAAQMGSSGAAPAAGTMVAPAKALDALLKVYEDEAIGVAKTMPADKYNFAPAKKDFAGGSEAKFEGVRTFAEQVAHVAQANYYFFANASGLKPDVDLRAVGTLKSKEELVKALEGSIAFGHRAIATITAQNAFEAIKPVDGQTTRATLAAFAVAHAYDHYGQMVEYLRMNGLVPPGSK